MTTGESQPDIMDKLLTMLESNGNVPPETSRRLQIEALIEILRRVKVLPSLEERVEILEHKNLITIVEKHPKLSVSVIFAAFVVLNFIAHSITPNEWVTALGKALGIP